LIGFSASLQPCQLGKSPIQRLFCSAVVGGQHAWDGFGYDDWFFCREKYKQVCELLGVNGMEFAGFHEEDSYGDEDMPQSVRSTPAHPTTHKDRTSIDDFQIIKPISRGAFGRVFLARKRATGDLFAIKVLRKADIIRKNTVESVQAERNILITVRNPFVVWILIKDSKTTHVKFSGSFLKW
jgi:hypothetical protein